LVGRAVVYHNSSVFYAESGDPGVTPNLYGPGYWLTNVRIGVRTRDDKYGVSIYANNLFNVTYFEAGNSGAGGNQLKWGNPRIVGGEITAKF